MKTWIFAAVLPAMLALAACNQPAAPGPGGPGGPAAPGAPAAGTEGGGLTGADRNAFVSSAVTSCTAKQQNDPSNQGIAMSTITAFCNCYANRMADKIPMSELPSLTTADPTRMQSMLQDRINEASSFCANQVRPAGGAPGNGGNNNGNNDKSQ